MKRFYYLVDSIAHTEQVAEAVYNCGISNWNFHVLSKDEAGLHRHHIHSATPFHRNDMLHTGERGALVGGLIGVVAATGVAVFAGMLDGYALFFVVVLLTCFGAWLGGMMGMSMDNYKIARFHDDIERGRHLVMLDVRRRQEPIIRRMMSGREGVIAAGEDSIFINPFRGGARSQ